MSRLIGLWGYAGAGKDEAAAALVADGWRRDAFADRLRTALLALNPLVPTPTGLHRVSTLVETDGWDQIKRDLPEIRELLQRLGTEAGREIHGQNCWVWPVIGAAELADQPTVITDVRFANEAQAIETAGGWVIAITRPGVGPTNSHASETSLANWAFDRVISNNGTVADLHTAIRKVATTCVST